MEKEQVTPVLTELVKNWKTLGLKDLAEKLGITQTKLTSYSQLVRDLSEKRYGKDGRYKVLPRKTPRHRNSPVTDAVNEMLDKVDAGTIS